MKFLDYLRRFGRLRWKLAFSYMAASVIGVFTVELILISLLGFVIFSPTYLTGYLVRDVNAKLPEAAKIMEGKSSALTQFLSSEFNIGKKGSFTIAIMMQDNKSEAAILLPDGRVAAGVPAKAWKPGSDGLSNLAGWELKAVRAALGGRGLTKDAVLKRNGKVFCAAPIRSRTGRIEGVLVLTGKSVFNPSKFVESMAYFVGATLLLIAALAGLVGIFFGFAVSRGLMRRLNATGNAAEAWSKGDFSAAAPDTSNDELGRLGRRLNTMADSLRKMIEVRQQLAASEERNRITRELHDTVKQQLFAASMLTATARARSAADGAPAEDTLSEVESILTKTQTDLTNVILKLTPPEDDWKNPTESFGELAAKWEARLGVPIRLRIDKSVELPALIGRVLHSALSEALTNAARHSGASEISVSLERENDAFLKLVVKDNGRGCPPESCEKPGHGLRIMRERIESLPGGKLDFYSSPGKGFEITARVFLPPEKSDNQNDG